MTTSGDGRPEVFKEGEGPVPNEKRNGQRQLQVIEAVLTMYADGTQFKYNDLCELVDVPAPTVNRVLHQWEKNALGLRRVRRATAGRQLISAGAGVGRLWQVRPREFVRVEKVQQPAPPPTVAEAAADPSGIYVKVGMTSGGDVLVKRQDDASPLVYKLVKL